MSAIALKVARDATLYAQFRTAFGVPLSAFPLMINQINDINQYRFPGLESNYFGASYVELIFSFRISYKDKSPDINSYLDECADIMQDTIGMMVDEIDFEGITPDSL